MHATQPSVPEHSAVSPKTRCQGRRPELTRINELYQRATQDRGASLVLVTGGPAIGKTTLLAEAQRQLHQRGASILEARCAPGLPSHAPLLEIARRAWEQLCGAGVEHALLEQVEPLFDLLQGRGADGPGSPEGRRLELYQRMADLLRLLGQQHPLVLVLHDLHLADRSTLRLLAYLARALAGQVELGERPFRGLLIASSDATVAQLEQLHHAGGLELQRLELGGLDAEGVRDYLSCDEVVQRVLGQTGGDPALLEAMTNTAPRPQATTPLEHASQAEAQLLELLAVFGRPLGAETLRLLTGLPLAELGRCLSTLTRRQVLEKRVVDGELRVGLARAGEQTAIYEALEPERRRALHGQVGAYLEQRGEHELEACASHLLKSGSPESVERCLAAGNRLERSLCFERAAELYEQAVPLANPRQQLELWRRLTAVHRLAGQLERALEFASRLRDARPGDRAAALELVNLHLLRRDPAAARAELEQLPVQKPDAQLLALAARVSYQAGERPRAREAARHGLELVHDDDHSHRISLQNTLGQLSLEDGEPDAARELFADNLQRARAAGLAEEQALALIQLGLVELDARAYEEAEHRYQQALQLTETLGEHRLRGACLQHLAVIAERRGAYDLALSRYQQAVTVWKQAWLRHYLAWVALDLGQLYIRLGQLERARAMAELSERMERDEAQLRAHINRALLRGRIARHECHYGEADGWFRRAAELAAADQQRERQQEAELELAELRLEQGLPQQTLTLLEERSEPVNERLRPRALLLQGRALLAAGQTDRARAPLAEAMELAEPLPDAEVAWQAPYLLALVSREQGRDAEARRLLDRAAGRELQVRQHVPAELAELVAEQPLRRGLSRALHEQGTPRCVSTTSISAPRATAFAGMVGRHPRMQQVFAHVEKVAATDALVLIRGESGTGKELVADAIHRRSKRGKRPLVKVNCGALVESLLLSELFGHERGAFTGATERRKGRFEAADGGTIFLDEIGDISPATQVALLRVLQQQEFERVGGNTPIKVDVRIICATNRDLEQLVAEGRFREDLYYRLKGLVVEVPALRERIEDLPLLCQHFLGRVARERNAAPRRLGEDALRLLRRHRWPGNVRELENVLRSVSLLSDSELLEVQDFADYPELAAPREAEAPTAPTHPYEQIRQHGIGLRELKKQIEHECIVEALQESGGSIAGAARLLGIKRPRLSQLVKEYGITVQRDR